MSRIDWDKAQDPLRAQELASAHTLSYEAWLAKCTSIGEELGIVHFTRWHTEETYHQSFNLWVVDHTLAYDHRYDDNGPLQEAFHRFDKICREATWESDRRRSAVGKGFKPPLLGGGR